MDQIPDIFISGGARREGVAVLIGDIADAAHHGPAVEDDPLTGAVAEDHIRAHRQIARDLVVIEIDQNVGVLGQAARRVEHGIAHALLVGAGAPHATAAQGHVAVADGVCPGDEGAVLLQRVPGEIAGLQRAFPVRGDRGDHPDARIPADADGEAGVLQDVVQGLKPLGVHPPLLVRRYPPDLQPGGIAEMRIAVAAVLECEGFDDLRILGEEMEPSAPTG